MNILHYLQLFMFLLLQVIDTRVKVVQLISQVRVALTGEPAGMGQMAMVISTGHTMVFQQDVQMEHLITVQSKT